MFQDPGTVAGLLLILAMVIAGILAVYAEKSKQDLMAGAPAALFAIQTEKEKLMEKVCKDCTSRLPNTIEKSDFPAQYNGHDFMSWCGTHKKHVLPMDEACSDYKD